MFENLVVNSWVAATDSCPVRFTVLGSDATRCQLGSDRDGFEMEFDAEALRRFVKLGADALRDMDARHAGEQAEISQR